MATIEKDKAVTSYDQKQVVSLKGVNNFSQLVLKRMLLDNIPPTPQNYQVYFEKLLLGQNIQQQKAIQEILDLEKDSKSDHIVEIEKNAKESFSLMKSLANSISIVYQKTRQMQALVKSKKEEIAKNPNKYTLVSFEEELNVLSQILNTHINNITQKYKLISKASKDFEDYTIYDKRFEVYNKKYLLSVIDSELESIKVFGHHSAILALKIDEESISNIKWQKDKTLLMKTVAKMILKTSRRSDIVSYYENDVFIIVLKHTNFDQALQTAQRVENMIADANFILDSQEVEVRLLTAVEKIDPNITKEQIIVSALDKLVT